MKKLLNISVIAALAILPMAANADPASDVTAKDPGATNASAPVAANAPKYSLAAAGANDDTHMATAGYVKGAYNAAIKAINKVSETASNALTADGAATLTNKTIDANGTGNNITNLETDNFASGVIVNSTTGIAAVGSASDTKLVTEKAVAQEIADEAVQTVTVGTANGTISVDGGADVVIYNDSALAGRVTTLEDDVGDMSDLTGTADTLVGAIEEVRGTAGFAGTGSELTDSHFTAADKTSASKAANAAMAAAAAAQSDVDAVETTIGNTTLTTTAQTLTGAIEEVKSNALTSSSLTDYAKKTGVKNTIETATITATVPTLTVWGNDSTTGTADVTVSSISASYAEPAQP